MILAVLLGFMIMEFVAYASHRYIMHGPMWFLHRSHHRERVGKFEANDWFGVGFSFISIALIWFGKNGNPYLIGFGLGMAAYGLAYLMMHDFLTHGRFGRVNMPKNSYLRRLVRAHRIHHSRDELDGTENFGFLWAPRVEKLRPEKLKSGTDSTIDSTNQI